MEDRKAKSFSEDRLPWPCWVEVDLDAIRHNVRALQTTVGSPCRIMAVVKAQAYGHGAVAVARAALKAGATWLAVARVLEGAQLRQAGLQAPILVLGPSTGSEIPDLVRYRLRPTVVDAGQVWLLSDAAIAAGVRLPIHLKLDTGLGRYGVDLETVRSVLREAVAAPMLDVEGLYSHFATADEPGSEFAASQLDAFRAAQVALEADGFHFPMVHMAASAATLALSDSHLDMVRIGLSLYGLYPSQHLSERADLRPALSLHSRVARVFRLEPGQSVGYGRTFVAAEPVDAALIPVGYADGLPRSHSNRGFVLIDGARARIIGRVSMDQCVVDVGSCGTVHEGDPAVVIGSQGDEMISCYEFAERSGTVSYETITSLGYRVPRVYRSGGRVVAVGYLDEGRLDEVESGFNYANRRHHRA